MFSVFRGTRTTVITVEILALETPGIRGLRSEGLSYSCIPANYFDTQSCDAHREAGTAPGSEVRCGQQTPVTFVTRGAGPSSACGIVKWDTQAVTVHGVSERAGFLVTTWLEIASCSS